MLTTIYLDDEAPFEAHEVENVVLKWDLPAKLEERQPPAAEQSPHGCLSVGRLTAQRFRESADTLGGTHFLLDVFTTTSNDSGLTFSAPLRLNGVSFDPETAAPDRFGNHTMRIGEYNGLSIGGDVAHAVWTGNRTTPSTQGTFYDSFAMPALATPTTTTVSPVAGQYSDVVTLSAQVQPTGWRMVIAGRDESGHVSELKAEIRKLKLNPNSEIGFGCPHGGGGHPCLP